MAKAETTKKEESEMSLLDQIKALDEKRQGLLETAKGESLKRAEDAVAELVALGFRYRLVEDGGAAQAGASRAPKDEPCRVCGFKTAPLHNGLMHRGQEPKRAFTAEELAERKLTRV